MELLEDLKREWKKPNNAVVQIILLNVIVFVVTGVLIILGFNFSDTIRSWFGLSSNLGSFLSHPWTIVTHAFVHDGFFHLLFNMLWLYWFGKIVQEMLGNDKVVALHALGILGGAIAFVCAYNIIPRFGEVAPYATLVGASAGVTSMVVGAATYFPNFTIFLMFIGPVRIKYIAIVTVFLSLIATQGGSNAGGEYAHLGGALAGWFYMQQLKKGRNIGGWIFKFFHFIKSFFKPQPKIKVTHRADSSRRTRSASSRKSKVSAMEVKQSDLDEILDKISERGYESLTKEEKQKLFNASKK